MLNKIRSKTVCLGAVIALTLAACGSDDSSSDNTSAPAGTSADSTSATVEASSDSTSAPASPESSVSEAASDSVVPDASGGEQPVVRVMTISPTNVGTWDPQHFLTYNALAKSKGWDLQIAEAVPYGEAEQVLRGWGEEGVDVVFAPDSGFGDAVLKVAPDYPDTVYAVMSSLGSTNDLPNVTAYAPDYCQMGYMAGAIGGLVSENGNVGVVSGTPVPAGLQFFNGAQQGFANESDGKDIKIAYSGDWIDPVVKAETAAGLVAGGADVIFSFDTVPTATDQRVQDLGKKVIGIFADESSFAPTAVVTSIVLNWQGYEETVDAKMAGTFKPGIHVLGFAEGLIDVLPVADAALSAQIDDIKGRLESGSVAITGDCG